MKFTGLFFLCFAVLSAGVRAQDAPDDPKGGMLVDCGGEKVAVFDRTESSDGRYALGWKVRPNRKKEPVDWSVYKPDDRGNFYAKHVFIGDDDGNMDKQDYRVVDGVLDLKAKGFTPLPSDHPYFPGKNRWDISVSWSEERRGIRYAVVGNQARFSTYNLWLVTLKNGTPRQVANLSPQADEAVSHYMRKRDPKDHSRYETTYAVGETPPDAERSGVVFKGNSLTIRFVAEIPKSEVDSDSGILTLALPKGNILRVVPAKKSRPNEASRPSHQHPRCGGSNSPVRGINTTAATDNPETVCRARRGPSRRC